MVPHHPDYRDTESVRVHKDLRLRFDGNRYYARFRTTAL